MTGAELFLGISAIAVSLMLCFVAYTIGIKGKDWRKAFN